MKKAHKLIEETEKSRKRPALESVCHRIDISVNDISRYVSMLVEKPFAEKEISSDNVKQNIHFLFKTYESVRYDLQKTMDIKEDDMNKLFPKVEFTLTDGYSTSASLLNVHRQLRHMRLYCERMLF